VVEKSPDAFRTISEAAEELDLPQHVLRFWETRFSTIKPLKRGGGRRYYRPEDVLLLKGIRHLLYDQGFTIKGVQKILKDHGVRNVIAIGDGRPMEPVTAAELAAEQQIDEPEIEVDADVVAETAVEGRAPRPTVPVLDQQGRDRLNKVMKDLLDCKRLLDRARET
jgi:DNA-binding transcriptional MerR regulator